MAQLVRWLTYQKWWFSIVVCKRSPGRVLPFHPTIIPLYPIKSHQIPQNPTKSHKIPSFATKSHHFPCHVPHSPEICDWPSSQPHGRQTCFRQRAVCSAASFRIPCEETIILKYPKVISNRGISRRESTKNSYTIWIAQATINQNPPDGWSFYHSNIWF